MAEFDEETKTSYIWKNDERRFLGFDGVRGLREKLNYAIQKNIGGFVILTPEGYHEDNQYFDIMASSSVLINDNSVNYDCDV